MTDKTKVIPRYDKHEDIDMNHRTKTRLSLNGDGSLDELVGTGDFQLEQMNDYSWFLCLGDIRIMLGVDSKGRLVATSIDGDWERPDG